MKQVLTNMQPRVTVLSNHDRVEATMATDARPSTATVDEGTLLNQIEVHSIDWIPDPERHGKNWQQAMLWFLGNFQYFTIPIGFIGPSTRREPAALMSAPTKAAAWPRITPLVTARAPPRR